MPPASQSRATPRPDERRLGSPRPQPGHEPRLAFRAALCRYKGTRLAAIRLAQGATPGGIRIRSGGNADEITEHLDQPAAVQALIVRLPPGSRLALSLFGLTESTSFSVAGLSHALQILECEPASAIVNLLELGLVAVDLQPEPGLVDEFNEILGSKDHLRVFLRVHPAVPKGVRTERPAQRLPTASGPIGQIREPDGLEAILRLAALWQRVGAEPLRQTQQGVLYKRDRDRIDLDPVLKAPIADSFIQLPDSPSLWLALARRVGLIELETGGERLLAAAPEFWTENEFHLPQMIATGWLALQTGYEVHAEGGAANDADSAVPFIRPALLLWLSTLGESEWVSLEDLAGHLSAHWPGWSRLSLVAEATAAVTPPRRGAVSSGRTRVRHEPGARPRHPGVLEAVLLGAAYPLGLIRAGEETSTGRRVVQLSPFGRYVLAVGPAPPPRPAFEKFLFVQPNFEVIAYRQGLTPQLVGRLSRFVWWTQIGSALELKLSRESIVHGLDLGSKPAWMLETLNQHSQRPLSRGVIDAINNWAERRERVIVYAAATLIEFGSEGERDHALELWPAGDQAAPVAVAARFLLVEDERTVPFDRLRMSSSRDYRRPPEVCVTVERDGITLSLDPARADLLVDAELAQFADPVALAERVYEAAAPAARQFTISIGSLRRGISRGMSPPRLSEWFERRTGGEIPPAVQLLSMAKSSRVTPLKAARMIVLTVGAPELLKGLRQHPATRDLLAQDLGPTSVAIPEDQVALLEKVLKELGIMLEFE